MKTALYLIPCTLGDTSLDAVLPPDNKKIVLSIRHFIVESRKCAVRFLISLDKNFPVDECTFFELSEHTAENEDLSQMLLPLEKGNSMGVISDAGCPGVGDPGSRAVEQAHKKSLPVVPLTGPNSTILALMASGFNGQNFAFNGYIPVKNGERDRCIKNLESKAYRENQTQLFIEAPYRNKKIFESIIKNCRDDTKLSVAAGITTEFEYISTKRIKDWKKSGFPPIEKIPAIFSIYR